MKKEVKLGLPKTSKIFLDLINAGDDFIVSSVEKELMMLMPIVKEDVAPHVCDFVKAGVPKEVIAYYFAYLTAVDGYSVYSNLRDEEIFPQENLTIADHFRFGKFEDKYLSKVEEEKTKRIAKRTAGKTM